MESALRHLVEIREGFCSLAEIMHHTKNASLETVCAAAVRDMMRTRLSWEALDLHMSSHTFPIIRLLPHQAHGGMSVFELKKLLGDSWMFGSNIDASVLWTVLLELTDDRDKAEHWWRDCEVNENPEQLWAWVKQLVMQWIQEKATKNTEVPVLKCTTPMGTEVRGPRFQEIVHHLERGEWDTSMGMMDCSDWTEQELKLTRTEEPPGFSAWFDHRMKEGQEENPMEHTPEQMRKVILAAMIWERKGCSELDLNHQELLDDFSTMHYPEIVHHWHKTRLKWEGQQLLLDGRHVPIMRVPCPPLEGERMVHPNKIPKELGESPGIKDPHLLAAFFEHVATSESTFIPRVGRRLWEQMHASENKALWLLNLQIRVCIQDSLHGFPEPPTWPESREGGPE